MTLEEYMKHMRVRLEQFETHWRKENAKNPQDWPMEFDSQYDWNEQLVCWLQQ